ncbi:MAG: methyltransferase domain-containing protein [Deltaproteobacteria bacterium]|nr:methyltransferase domain-containing protein [Deltaproteobacteria bacterium]
MRPSLLEHLCCPACRAPLKLGEVKVDGGWIEEGSLTCTGCALVYGIEYGVPNFVEPRGRADVQQTTSGFARNWNAFNDIILEDEKLNDELFRDWILPMDPEVMRGKIVLEPGCGMGRWLRVAATYSPKILIGLDYSEVAYTAGRNTKDLENVHVVRADILRMPLKTKIELTYCLGVVHHTPEPSRTFDALVEAMSPAGAMCVWVYGKENNGWIHNFVTPMREHVTSRLPHGLLNVMSKVLAAQLYLMAGAYKLGLEKLGMPYADYLRYLRRYPFRYMEHIVYDHLVPQIAHYHSGPELEGWAKKNKLQYLLSPRNNNSWRLHVAWSQAQLPGKAEPAAGLRAEA